MSMLSEESFEPINSGPPPKLNVPRAVPPLDFAKMTQILEKEKVRKEKREKREANSFQGKRANSHDNSHQIPDMLGEINHNKYAKQNAKAVQDYEQLKKKAENLYEKEEYEDYYEDSSP